MEFPVNFISATKECCSYEKHIAAPYIRKSFKLNKKANEAKLIICGLGFYKLYINGTDITKGALAPYISNPDDIIYYDEYSVGKYLKEGDNAVAVLLGNGMQNAFGGYVWDFEKAKWRGAPKVALKLEIEPLDEEKIVIESDESFKTHPSPIIFDELRSGEYYDARNITESFADAGFDDSSWDNAIIASVPRGEPMLCTAEPIVITKQLKPVSIKEINGSYLYDFGVNSAGVCKLIIEGECGQEITMEHGEYLKDGIPVFRNLMFSDDAHVQKNKYICSGKGVEEYIPSFTYDGFQFVLVNGITKEQATENLLTYLVMNSDLKECGNFECSDEILNKLQMCTRNSTLANFYYFPTDCPHREKNGWTADAALSAEHALLNLTPEKSYQQWLENIRKSMREDGALPGIVPTGGWGFQWGNGPAWDSVLIYLPYFVYTYRGNIRILKENATAIFRYIHYINTRLNERGLIEIGLGDWCAPVIVKSPLEFTDSVISMDLCAKAAFIFEKLNMELEREFAMGLYNKLRSNIRKYLIDFGTMTAIGNCQTSQAMAIFYNVFDEGEKDKAFARLIEYIERRDYHLDTGVLGARVIFHVLSMFGRSDAAYDMITNPTNPSYADWILRGATSLWEDFNPEGSRVNSLNHHFFGDISNWFITQIAGIQVNPYRNNINEVKIAPKFISKLEHAKAYHILPAGKVEVSWKRAFDKIILNVYADKGIKGKIVLENGYVFENTLSYKDLITGSYVISKE